MPIFELDDGRTRPVQPLQPRAGTFVAEVRALLADQLGAVIGEALFPVRPRASLPEHADAPELLALDGGGRPVVIEATQVVDDDALIVALRHTGVAGRLTGTDLARAYHPEPTRFANDFATFFQIGQLPSHITKVGIVDRDRVQTKRWLRIRCQWYVTRLLPFR